MYLRIRKFYSSGRQHLVPAQLLYYLVTRAGVVCRAEFRTGGMLRVPLVMRALRAPHVMCTMRVIRVICMRDSAVCR